MKFLISVYFFVFHLKKFLLENLKYLQYKKNQDLRYQKNINNVDLVISKAYFNLAKKKIFKEKIEKKHKLKLKNFM